MYYVAVLCYATDVPLRYCDCSFSVMRNALMFILVLTAHPYE